MYIEPKEPADETPAQENAEGQTQTDQGATEETPAAEESTS